MTRIASAGGNLSYFCSITSSSGPVLRKQRYCTALPTQLPYIQSCLSLIFSLSVHKPHEKSNLKCQTTVSKSMNLECRVSGFGAGALGKKKHHFFLKACFTNKKTSRVSFFSSDNLKRCSKPCIFFLLLHKKNGRLP